MEKVNSLVSKLFLAVHRSSKCITVPPVSIAWSVAFIGALEQLRDSSWWIPGHVSEEKSPEKFFFVWTCVIAFVGKTLTLTEKKELEVLPSLDHSLTHVRSLCRWVRSHWSEERERERERERGRANSKKRQKRSAQVDVLCSFFCSTARRSPVIGGTYLNRPNSTDKFRLPLCKHFSTDFINKISLERSFHYLNGDTLFWKSDKKWRRYSRLKWPNWSISRSIDRRAWLAAATSLTPLLW